MKAKLLEHVLGIILVSVLLIGGFYIVSSYNRQNEKESFNEIAPYVNIDFINYSDPFHKALLGDVMNIYFPGKEDENQGRVQSILQHMEQNFTETLKDSHLKQGLTGSKVMQILGMYGTFIFVYLLVLTLTFYGVQTLGAWQFVRKKRKSESVYKKGKKSIVTWVSFPIKLLIKGVCYLILFSPAYVIAYSIRTEFNTDTLFFMILLAVLSNGLLITYTNKFYTFLVSESRKGYVETARAKNLFSSYANHKPEGISLGEIVHPIKRFHGHVFGHIFKNAQVQYLQTIKEQASFLITGLIIIEMALNIHGHLSYELLQQILYKNYEVVILIVLGIFYVVKLTEIGTDYLAHRVALAFENRRQ